MNTIIVFGNGLNNTLGLIRSLGEAGLCPVLILVSKNSKMSCVQYSRYIKCCHYVNTQEQGLDVICSDYGHEALKPIVLFAGDPPVCLMDAEYDRLHDKFSFFNAGAQGRINHYMNKINTFPIAEKHGLSTIKTFGVNGLSDLPSEIAFPCMVKGNNSTTSTKADMRICFNSEELHSAIKPGISYLVQEYIKKDYELDVIGFSWNHGKDVYIPAVARKIRDDITRQSAFVRLDDIAQYTDLNAGAIKSMIGDMHYEGIFSVELIKSNGKYYFLEVNLRNDACGYLYTVAGINYPLLWVLYCQSKLSWGYIERLQFKVPMYLMHRDDLFNVLERKVGVLEWLHDLTRTKAWNVYSIRDPYPFVRSVFNLIVRIPHKVMKHIG